MDQGSVWIWASSNETAKHVKKVFDDAKFLNPVHIVPSELNFRKVFQSGKNLPLMFLLDLLPGTDQTVLDILLASQGTLAEQMVRFVALIDETAEKLLDRAYDAGVKSHLRKPVTFHDFLQRARLLNLGVAIGRAG